MNTPIQGSAADIIKLAMIHMSERLKREGLKTKMLLQVHDELIFEVPPEELEILKKIVPEEMENAIELNVPLKVDYNFGSTWFDAKSVDRNKVNIYDYEKNSKKRTVA